VWDGVRFGEEGREGMGVGIGTYSAQSRFLTILPRVPSLNGEATALSKG
jgi:hypothetical protein